MIAPYKRPPEPPRMAVLTPWGAVVDEDGAEWAPGTTPEETRPYAPHETVRALLTAGVGEALCWNGQPIRWRPGSGEVGWVNRPTDVTVLRCDFPEPAEALAGLAGWRDWLAAYGAAPIGTMGAASWSLLRATLDRPLWLGIGDKPPIRWALGGRQEQSVPAGTYLGRFTHWDIPAAYASTLAGLAYGGRWREVDAKLGAKLAAKGHPVFVRARVRVPPMPFGPVPRRPRGRPGPWEQILWSLAGQVAGNPSTYPVAKTVRGVWSHAEVEAAERGGCGVRIETTWAHAGHSRMAFVRWWGAVQEGRRMPGFGGHLAKMTGNALVGRFALSPGDKTVLSFKKGKRRAAQVTTNTPPAWLSDPILAETVTGAVRARLWSDLLTLDPDSVLCVHTDGGWVREGTDPGPGWVAKDQAERIDLLGPQALAFRRPGAQGLTFRVAGVPSAEAPAAFEDRWRALFREGA